MSKGKCQSVDLEERVYVCSESCERDTRATPQIFPHKTGFYYIFQLQN